MFFPERAPLIALPQATIAEWEIVAKPGAFAIDLNTVKDFLNIPQEDNFFNAEKQAFIIQAQKAIEHHCKMSLLTTTWVGNFPGFYNSMRVICRPFRSVTKIEYVDYATGEILTLDPSYYVWGKAAQRCGVVNLAEGMSWPRAANRYDAVRVTVQSGWEKKDLPDEIINALMQTIAALDHARADDAGQSAVRSVYALKHQQAPSIIPTTAQALLSPYRYFSVVAG